MRDVTVANAYISGTYYIPSIILITYINSLNVHYIHKKYHYHLFTHEEIEAQRVQQLPKL